MCPEAPNTKPASNLVVKTNAECLRYRDLFFSSPEKSGSWDFFEVVFQSEVGEQEQLSLGELCALTD